MAKFRRLTGTLLSVSYKDVKAAEEAEKRKRRKGRPAKAGRPPKG